MRPPDRRGTSRREAPHDDPALGVAGRQQRVAVQEVQRVDGRRVAAQDICWIGWWGVRRARGAVAVGVHAAVWEGVWGSYCPGGGAPRAEYRTMGVSFVGPGSGWGVT